MNLNFKKKIEHPTVNQLGISLIPAGLLIIYVFISHSFPLWVLIGMIASIVLYLGLMTYFCLKQKCYWQLIWICIQLLPVVVLLIYQYCYLEKYLDSISK